MIGRQLGHYRITAKLGEGGMGTVYVAEDEHLDRRVALKVLPPETADSAERLGRFRREARVLASLNHPNIVTVHSIESVDGVHFLTMELLEGRTLSDCIPKNGVSLVEFFRVTIPLADALSAAHETGLIHRDLKPSNVFLTDSGAIKVLDFGLAKLRPSATTMVDSEAKTDSLTGEGRILGTVPYMSPEQLQGRRLDHRSDIFSLGILMYELATGDRPFGGSTSVDVASSILRDSPTPVDDLRRELPQHVSRVIGLCLEKDPDQRMQSAKDLRNELAQVRKEWESGRTELEIPRPRVARKWFRRRPSVASLLGLVVALVVGVIFVVLREPTDDETRPMKIPMAPPPGLKPSLGFGPTVAISDDGETIAYVLEEGTATRLYVKESDRFETRALPGTEGARSPAFSPSGEWIVFFDEDDRRLKKIALSGGEPLVLAQADGQWGLTWASDETIVFSSTYSGLMRVSAGGGEPEALTRGGRMQHFWPTALPGRDVVLFSVLSSRGSFDEATIVAQPLGGGEAKVVLEGAYYPHYSPAGYLVFVQAGAVVAAPFDPDSLEVTGRPRTVLDDVWTSSWTGYADFAMSRTGTLIYVSGGPDPTRARLVSVDRHGEAQPLVEERRPYRLPRLAPDGGLVAVTIVEDQVDVWTLDVARGSLSRRTDSPSWEGHPQWVPGGGRIAFASMRGGWAETYWQDLETERVEKLFDSEYPTYPRSWSPDGGLLVYDEENPETGWDLRIFSVERGATEAFLASPYNESAGEFSPDGRYIAYQSDEAGDQLEVYVRPYPEGTPRYKISTRGGRTPRWGPDGREIFYQVGSRMMAVPITAEPGFAVGTPVELFRGAYGQSYDVSRDGQSFIMLQEMAEGDPPLRINLVTDWLAEIDDAGDD